jgi:hypothetical protein
MKLSQVHDRLSEALHAKVRVSERYLTRPSVRGKLFVKYRGEELDNPFLEYVEWLSAQNNQLHAICRVVLSMKLDELVPHVISTCFRKGLENLKVAGVEVVVRVFGIG